MIKVYFITRVRELGESVCLQGPQDRVSQPLAVLVMTLGGHKHPKAIFTFGHFHPEPGLCQN